MSQFDSLFKTNAEPKTETKPKDKPAKKKAVSSPSLAAVKTLTPAKAEKRQTGKSSNPDYAQVLTYIKRDTHRAVKKALLDDAANRDLSDLVEQLLADWVKKIPGSVFVIKR